MTAIRLGRERLTAVSNGFADLISDTGGSTPTMPNGFLNGSVFGNDMGSLSAHHTGEVGEQSRRCPVWSPPESTSSGNAANFRLSTCRNSAGTPANLDYLVSAASCWFAFWTAVFTATRNESVLAGGCTSPDSVLRKETSLP